MRLTFDNNYFNALYQGIPIGGYTKLVENLLDGIEVQLNVDYLVDRAKWDAIAEKVVYTGAIDAFLIIRLAIWSIVPFVLKMKFWISRIFKEMQQ